MDTVAKIVIEEGFENKDPILKMVEDAARELGISQKLKDITIKHTPSDSPIDMNYLNSADGVLVLEIVDDVDNLDGRVVHELMHVFDQLEEGFKYREDSVPKDGSGAYRRYKYLWNVYIDGRLIKSGKPAYNTRVEREKEIDECYPELSEYLRKRVFEFLWDLDPFVHEQIVEMSHDLFSGANELKSLADSRGEKIESFRTLEELKSFKR
ncbi:MAG: hypothetical protein GY941_09830 [Planctomycetes bacterium]|nr:hypothetical protein [Planctomycetota bacterium]